MGEPTKRGPYHDRIGGKRRSPAWKIPVEEIRHALLVRGMSINKFAEVNGVGRPTILAVICHHAEHDPELRALVDAYDAALDPGQCEAEHETGPLRAAPKREMQRQAVLLPEQRPVDRDLIATGGRYAAIWDFAASRGMPVRLAMQRYHAAVAHQRRGWSE